VPLVNDCAGNAAVGETPGCKCTKVAASRPMDGKFCSMSPLMVLPTVAFMVCSFGVSGGDLDGFRDGTSSSFKVDR